MSQPKVVNGKDLVGPLNLSDEMWREYSFITDGVERVYRIAFPQALYYRTGGTTHRVVDNEGVVHCVPAVGTQQCVLRWKTFPSTPSVRF